MRTIITAIICALACTSMNSCKETLGEQRTAQVKDVHVLLPQGVGSVEVTADIIIDNTLVTVPCQVPSTAVRLLAAKQEGILNTTTAYVWYKEGKYVNIDKLAFNSTNDLR